MKTLRAASCVILVLVCFFAARRVAAQPGPGGPNPYRQLDTWSFTSNNWFSDAHYAPVAYSNIVNLTNVLWLDTDDETPAYLFYNLVETNGFTNLICSNGTISLWFSPDWSSTDRTGGDGPGDWANLISLGLCGTNGPWWAWYFDPDGLTLNFASQTNGGTPSYYISAPVSLAASNWCNLVLTYSPTNTSLYLNGVSLTNGSGLTAWPGPDISFFAIGSDTNGFYQAEGMFSYVQTYNYELDPFNIAGNFGVMSVFYGIPGVGSNNYQQLFVSAPPTSSVVPVFDAVTGLGFLHINGTNGTCYESNNVVIANMSAVVTNITTNTIVNYTFSIQGGSNGYNYDVFFTPVLQYPITNSTWYWMGQGPHCTTYTLSLTNSPNLKGYFILGTPQDSDSDGLTDAYERLVSHTDPSNPYSGNDGMLDGWKVVWGLPFSDPTAQTSLRSGFTYDPVGRLDLITGIRTETLTNDFEGNILLAH